MGASWRCHCISHSDKIYGLFSIRINGICFSRYNHQHQRSLRPSIIFHGTSEALMSLHLYNSCQDHSWTALAVRLYSTILGRQARNLNGVIQLSPALQEYCSLPSRNRFSRESQRCKEQHGQPLQVFHGASADCGSLMTLGNHTFLLGQATEWLLVI